MPEQDEKKLAFDIAKKNDNEDYIPLPVLVSQDEYDVTGEDVMYLVQSKDYRFAQFLQIIQNRSTFDLIFNVLERGIDDENLSEEEKEESAENLVGFCYLLYMWAKACNDINPNYIPEEMKGEQKDEFNDISN